MHINACVRVRVRGWWCMCVRVRVRIYVRHLHSCACVGGGASADVQREPFDSVFGEKTRNSTCVTKHNRWSSAVMKCRRLIHRNEYVMKFDISRYPAVVISSVEFAIFVIFSEPRYDDK